METFQDRVINRIEATCSRFEFSTTIARNYSNVGTIYISETANDVESIAEIGFNFQSGTYTLTLTVLGKKIPSQSGRNDYFDFYTDNGKPSAFWRILENQLGALSGVAT